MHVLDAGEKACVRFSWVCTTVARLIRPSAGWERSGAALGMCGR